MENKNIFKVTNSNDIFNIEKKLEKSILTSSDISNTIHNQNYTYLLYNIDGINAGYLCYTDCIDHIDLIAIAVIPEYRKQHIACMLLETMLKNTTKDIFLEVRASNNAAIKLYEKFEFEKIYVRKNYYSQPYEDAIIYKKTTSI